MLKNKAFDGFRTLCLNKKCSSEKADMRQLLKTIQSEVKGKEDEIAELKKHSEVIFF